MLQALAEFFVLAATAIFAENAVFSRGLGMSRMIRMPVDAVSRTRFCLIVTAMSTACTGIGWWLNRFIREAEYAIFIRPMLYIGLICVLYCAVWLLGRKFWPKFFAGLRGDLAMATFNCAVLGPALLASQSSFTFPKALGFGLGSGIGYLGAVLLVGQVRQRLELCDVPKAFRGFPITLVYIGLLSLALYGLIGHRLPI